VVDFRPKKPTKGKGRGVMKTFLPPSPSKSLHFSSSRPRAAKINIYSGKNNDFIYLFS
jgi:hypothetical protein